MTESPSSRPVRWQSSLTLFLFFQCAIAGALWRFLNLQLWPAWLLGGTAMTFLAYAVDKLSAVRGWRRTPELTLFLLILAGGFAGGWTGQILFRHKTRKGIFWFVLILAPLLHGLALWFFRDQFGWRRS